MTVLELPPRLSWRRKERRLSRYGTCRCLPLETSTRAMMTCPSADRDLLMLHASLSSPPVAPVDLCRSLPARSTRLSRDVRRPCEGPPRCSTVHMKTAWERDDSAFIRVLATRRTPLAASRRPSTSLRSTDTAISSPSAIGTCRERVPALVCQSAAQVATDTLPVP